ncbi:50S ribosomal protein L6 [Desulfobotulus sp.]|jgi:large subunit ribosomal protein L6|uniref:50S ribosomal protein L6 n=1 Tax=Desulfobotulus sp. TaxID=1940337 RepID=UPI002A35A786|nr:50S ribosomal protein L6 [Desulfobotulus sp.]MDY0163634.1 50S ribosomal protein L6 [Desulfobotulus sp.]
MSRIGKKPIQLPAKAKVSYANRVLTVEGSLGKLQREIHPDVDLEIQDQVIHVKALSDERKGIAFQGMTRALVANMVTGVSQGFKKVLQINGIGYRAELKDNVLSLHVGYSNPVGYPVPEGISLSVEKNNDITVSGIDKQKVGQVAAEIRAVRPPEPYKGKGIKYADEHIMRKAGKSAK